jgi:hypothetical protein
MSRGGHRPGAGRPKKGISAPPAISSPPAAGEYLPATDVTCDDALAYVRALMNDPTADPRRRDWAAGVLAMYTHPRPAAVAAVPPRQQAQRRALQDDRTLREDFEARAIIIRGRFGAR